MSSFPRAAAAAITILSVLGACSQPANLAGMETPPNQGRNTSSCSLRPSLELTKMTPSLLSSSFMFE